MPAMNSCVNTFANQVNDTVTVVEVVASLTNVSAVFITVVKLAKKLFLVYDSRL